MLAKLFSHRFHSSGKGFWIQNHLHHADLIFPSRFIGFITNFLLKYMVDWESQRNSCQGTCKCRVAVRYGLCINFCAFRIGRTKNDHNVFSAILFSSIFNTLLVLQIHGSCGGSDEAFGHREDDIGAAVL